jgi:hypothetical protein
MRRRKPSPHFSSLVGKFIASNTDYGSYGSAASTRNTNDQVRMREEQEASFWQDKVVTS